MCNKCDSDDLVKFRAFVAERPEAVDEVNDNFKIIDGAVYVNVDLLNDVVGKMIGKARVLSLLTDGGDVLVDMIDSAYSMINGGAKFLVASEAEKIASATDQN